MQLWMSIAHAYTHVLDHPPAVSEVRQGAARDEDVVDALAALIKSIWMHGDEVSAGAKGPLLLPGPAPGVVDAVAGDAVLGDVELGGGDGPAAGAEDTTLAARMAVASIRRSMLKDNC